MELQNNTPVQSPANNATVPVATTFAIAGIIKLPIKHASLVATIGAVFTVLYLLDLFFDINPIKDMYLKAFPRSKDENPS